MLAAPVIQLTCDTLPLTMREGDKQAHPNDQPEDNDWYVQSSSRQHRMLGQSLSTVLAEGTDILAYTGIECTP